MTKDDLLSIADLDEGDLPEELESPGFDEWLGLFRDIGQNVGQLTDSRNTAEHVRDYLMDCLQDEEKRDGQTYYLVQQWFESSRAAAQAKKQVNRRRPNSALSRAAKRRWSKNRSKYKKGIQRYHSSTKGKKFHKNLSRQLRRSFSEAYQPTEADLLLVAKAVSSGMTHLVIEFEERQKEGRALQEEDIELLQVAGELSRKIIEEVTDALLLDEGRQDHYRDAVTMAAEIFVDSSVENDFSETITEQEVVEDWDVVVTVPKQQEQDVMAQYSDQYDTVKKQDLGNKVKLMFRNSM